MFVIDVCGWGGWGIAELCCFGFLLCTLYLTFDCVMLFYVLLLMFVLFCF